MIKSFFAEFKKFAMRGNVIDMDVGIIIGALGGLIDLYIAVGIVLSFLDYFKVIK